MRILQKLFPLEVLEIRVVVGEEPATSVTPNEGEMRGSQVDQCLDDLKD